MTYENFGALDASITAQLEADNDFQTSVADLSDDEKNEATKTKKSELLDQAIKELGEGKGTKFEELANNYKTRAEKAEKTNKKDKKDDEGTADSSLSYDDMFALNKAEVIPEDIEVVKQFATLNKVSIIESLKSPIVKGILADKVEKRKTAEATATGTNRSGSVKKTDEQVVADASAGKIPEKGTPEAEQLFWARRKKK